MIAHVLGVTQIASVLQHVTWKSYYKILFHEASCINIINPKWTYR